MMHGCFTNVETIQLTYIANKLIGYYMNGTLSFLLRKTNLR